MASFVVSRNTLLKNEISAVERVLAFHTTMHRQSFKSMDCITNLLHSIFLDSLIVTKNPCAITKAEAIITSGVISTHAIDILLKDLREITYLSISTYHRHGNKKYFPVFDHSKCGIQTRLFNLRESSNEMANTIATFLEMSP